MKKVAFTLGLAFFAIGLFAQTSSTAKPASSALTTTKREPLKTAPTQTALKPAAKPAATPKPAATAKPAATPAAKPASTATPLAKKATTDPAKAPVKKHRRHHKKAVTPASGTEKTKSAPMPKKN